MISSKQQVRSYLKDYLALKFSSINFNKQYFDCPFKAEHFSEVTYATSNISKNHVLFCSHPSHIKIGDIFQIVRKVEPDMKDMDDEDIQQYLVDLFKIQTDDHIDILLNKYVEYGFDLVPVAKNEKNPIEKEWQKKSHKNKQEWLEWIDAGLNVGVKTGKLSNILVIDIDADIIPESLKNILPATLIQKTNKGWHFVYKFDESISKTSFEYEGVHIDIQGEGGQIVVAPSEINGQKRNWNFHTIEEITSELKEFILKNSKPQSKIETLISDDTLGKIKGLEGNCNNTFVKVAGQFRKFMSLDQVEKSLYFINDTMLDSPMQHKALRSMIREIEKYHEADREELSKQILTRLDKVDEVTIRDLVYSLRQEQKDIEDTLRDLIDKELIYRKGSKYKVFQKADWKESFITESKLIDFKMPYFDQYATFRNGDMIVIGAKTGIGKCFGKGTKILMYDGSYKKVENIQLNDLIMGIDSKSRKVLNLHSGKDQLYKIKPIKGDSFIVNSKHILSLKKTGTNNTINISVEDYLQTNKTFKHLHKLYRVPIEFNSKKLPLDPYWFGLWLGDGDSRDSRITTIDKPIINFIKQYAKKLHLKFVTYKYKFCGSYKMSSKQGNWQNQYNIKQQLRKLNVIENKHIPNMYKINSRKNRLNLLAGLIDSDGYIYQTTVDFCLVNKQLAEDIKFLAGSLGFFSYIREKSINNKVYYRISIIGDTSIIPIKLKRKQSKKRIQIKNPLYTGFKIKPYKYDNYYGFEIDGNHLHLIKDFIVQHNSHLALNIIQQLVKQGQFPHYISSEPGNRFSKIAMTLGLQEGQFRWCNHYRPEQIELEENAITIIDWLLPENYAETDKLYQYFAKQLDKHKGICIIFCQLNREGEFMAKNMIDWFASLSCKYCHSSTKDKQGNTISDNNNTFFQTEKIRESKCGKQYITIPTYYDSETKFLTLRTGNA